MLFRSWLQQHDTVREFVECKQFSFDFLQGTQHIWLCGLRRFCYLCPGPATAVWHTSSVDVFNFKPSSVPMARFCRGSASVCMANQRIAAAAVHMQRACLTREVDSALLH